jgi:hypothetical protein
MLYTGANTRVPRPRVRVERRPENFSWMPQDCFTSKFSYTFSVVGIREGWYEEEMGKPV